jgi:hypothetical protein
VLIIGTGNDEFSSQPHLFEHRYAGRVVIVEGGRVRAFIVFPVEFVDCRLRFVGNSGERLTVLIGYAEAQSFRGIFENGNVFRFQSVEVVAFPATVPRDYATGLDAGNYPSRFVQ